MNIEREAVINKAEDKQADFDIKTNSNMSGKKSSCW